MVKILVAGIGVQIRLIVFGVDDFLLAVKSVITGDKVTDGNGEQEPFKSCAAKKLQSQEKGSNGAICRAAEQTNHAHCRTESRIDAEKTAEDASQCCADEQRRNDLAAFIAGLQRDSGEQDF